MKFYHSLLLAGLLFFAISTSWSQTDCNGYNPDVDDDNAITITDLLALLGLFEEVDTDNDGVWDSVDDCIGALDVCGVCNGPGPTVVVGDSLVCPIYGCTDNLASNFSASANTDDGTCTYGPAQCGGQSTVTFDGHSYNLVAIGDQCWFRENLRTDNYRNGDEIPGNLNDGEWASTVAGAQAVYNNDPANLLTYGRLYNWYVVDDTRGICPSGFHVPSDGEWMVLEMSLGLTSAQSNETGWRGTDQGLQMKSSATDSPPWNGTNSSGFSALPGGGRHSDNGYFNYLGDFGDWWSSSPSGSNPWLRALNSGNSNVGRNNGSRVRSGFSIRCLKD